MIEREYPVQVLSFFLFSCLQSSRITGKEFVMRRKSQKRAGAILGISVIDHIIVGDTDYYSFRDGGELDEE